MNSVLRFLRTVSQLSTSLFAVKSLLQGSRPGHASMLLRLSRESCQAKELTVGRLTHLCCLEKATVFGLLMICLFPLSTGSPPPILVKVKHFCYRT